MPALKKCYYEVLGVDRTATDEDIKRSFRKLALQLHPDKNPEKLEEAKSQFQDLQQAYEVLSNSQERAWYDEHRHAILRGGLNENFVDDGIDIFPYCTSSCYKGFGDDELGFYTVYRKLFEKIAQEEVEAGLEDTDDEIPSFGDSESSYIDDVKVFYGFWEAFCTRKNFAWMDEYDTRYAESRRISRLMDKENKKVRSEAKKEWNLRVRALVDFVKRKDKRVQAWKAQQEIKQKEKEALLARKLADDKAKRQKERNELLKSVCSQNRDSHLNKVQLKEMEEWMSSEFCEPLSDEEEDCLYCEVCNKSFRSEKAFMNHEKSKKHLTLLQALKKSILEDDAEFYQDEVSDDKEVSEEGYRSEHENPLITKEQAQIVNHHDLKVDGSTAEDNEEEEHLLNFINTKLKKVGLKPDSDLSTLDDDKSKDAKGKLKKRRRAPKDKTKAENEVSYDFTQKHQNKKDNGLSDFNCKSCKKEFDSKTQLFKHLKHNPGHAVLKETGTEPFIGNANNNKGKKLKK